MITKAEQLTAYCGRFCGTCGISGFAIGTNVAAVRAVVKAAGLKHEAEQLGWPLMRDLATHCCAQFEGQVESFGALTTKLFPTNCRGGCVPPCGIAACCKEKGHTTCASCGDMEDCDKLSGIVQKYPALRDNLRAIALQGLRAWSEAQLKEAKAARRAALVKAVEKAVG